MNTTMQKTLSTRKHIFTVLILLLLNFLSIQLSSAQNTLPGGYHPGFVISQAGDTLHGYISQSEGRSAYFQCSFIAQPGDPVQTFGPMDSPVLLKQPTNKTSISHALLHHLQMLRSPLFCPTKSKVMA